MASSDTPRRLTATVAAAAAAWRETFWLWLAWLRGWWAVRVLRRSASAAALAGPQADDWAVLRVFAFREPVDGDDGAGDDAGFVEIAPRDFRIDGTWEADVADLTGWTSFRAEVRYALRGKKYRAVLRPGDAIAWPPYGGAPRPACRLPKGVILARLCGPETAGCDVTARVQKYGGPHKDFHAGAGLRVRVQDMFPFDDQADNAERFDRLVVTDALGRTATYAYGENPEMSS